MAKHVETQVLVIGAGMAGLVAAADLHRQGIDVIVLEASSRIGGRVNSTKTSLGTYIDLGGHWIGYGHHRLTELVQQGNGTIYKTFTQGMPKIVYQGRVVSLFSPSILLVAFYIIFFDVISRIYVPRTWRTITAEQAISKWVPLETTREMLRLIVNISCTAELQIYSIYNLAKAIPMAGGMATILGTEGGAQDSLVAESIGCVTAMLEQQIGTERIRTSSIVTSLCQDQETGVILKTASGQVFKAKKVIVTVPPPMLESISFDPPLPIERQELQRKTRMGVVYKAIAVFERPFWRDTVGGEFLVLDDPAIGFSDTSPPDGPGHLCLLIGGTPARQLDELSVESRRELLLSRLASHIGRQILQPLEWHEKLWHLDEYCGGGYLAFPVVGTDILLPMPHQPIMNIHWAGTETAQEHPGYIEGAVQSGQRAALEVLRAL